MKQTLFALLAALSLSLLAQPAQAHDVKDPVCRMTVDSDTARYKHKLGNRTFYFCSRQCEVKFAQSPAKYEKLADQLERQDLHEYTVDFKTAAPPMAGQPVQMEFAIRYKKDGKLVPEFEVIHEKLLHLIMVTEDLSWFEHQHPVRGEDGIFRLTWTFPRFGAYRLYADFTPADGDNQILPISLSVGRSVGKSVPLVLDTRLVKEIGDLRFEVKLLGGPLRMEKPVLLTYTIRDRQGRAVKDIQPFIGAPGHLLAISQDGKEVVHTHALQSASQPSMGGQKEPFVVTPAMVTETGPAFSFKLTVPTAGLYKTWAQFQRAGQVYTVPFTFRFADLWAPATAASGTTGNVQRATVVIDGEYLPGKVEVKAGQPVELTFVRKEKVGCGDVVQFPGLGIKRTLKPGEKTVVRFTPKKSGIIPFTCGMKMYRGHLAVK
jgi:YHS domain-containing protein